MAVLLARSHSATLRSFLVFFPSNLTDSQTIIMELLKCVSPWAENILPIEMHDATCCTWTFLVSACILQFALELLFLGSPDVASEFLFRFQTRIDSANCLVRIQIFVDVRIPPEVSHTHEPSRVVGQLSVIVEIGWKSASLSASVAPLPCLRIFLLSRVPGDQLLVHSTIHAYQHCPPRSANSTTRKHGKSRML